MAAATTTNKWLSIRQTADHPYTGEDFDTETRTLGDLSYCPWAKLYWFWVPMTVFRKGTDNMRYLNDDPSHKGVSDMLYELFMIFCAIFGVSAIHSGKTKDGATTFARHVATVSVVRSKNNPDEIAGMLFGCSYASHQSEDDAKGGQELRMQFEPSSMLHAHLERSDQAKVAKATGYNGGKPFQKGSNGKDKDKETDCEQDRYFRDLTRERWRKLADYYMGSDAAGLKGLNEDSENSCYYPYKLWSFQNAMSQALASDADPSFFERAQWKWCNGYSGVLYPFAGKYTYRFPACEYAPRSMAVAMLPHIKPPLPATDDIRFRRVLRVFYNGTVPAPGQRLEDGDAMNQYESAVEAANFVMLQNENDISIDDGSIDIHAAITTVENEQIHKQASDELAADVKRLGPEFNNGHLQEHQRRLRTKLDEWENVKIAQWKTRFTAHNSKLSEAECATAKFMNDYLSENRIGGFCMPHSHKYKHLSEFGNLVATNLLYQEFVNKSYLSHRAMIITQYAVLSTWIGGLDEEQRAHIMQTGDAAAGKSNVLEVTKELCIVGTCKNINGTSAKSEMVEGNRGLHKMNIMCHEAPPDKWGIGQGNGKTLRGQTTASAMANNTLAATHRDMLTSGIYNYSTQETNQKTGVRYNKVVNIKAQSTQLVNTNAHQTEIAGNTIDRVEVIEYDTDTRRNDISMAFVAASERTPQADAMKKLLVRLFRRNQLMIAIISTWINMRVLDRIDTSSTDILFMKIQTAMSDAGLKNASNNKRAAKRLRLVVKVLCILHAIYVVLDSPLRLIDSTKPWTDESWVKLKDIRYHLVTKPEHLIYAWTLLKTSWQAPGVPEFVNALIDHYALDVRPSLGESPAVLKERKMIQDREDRKRAVVTKPRRSKKGIQKEYKDYKATEFMDHRSKMTEQERILEQELAANEYENAKAQAQLTGNRGTGGERKEAEVVGYTYIPQTSLLRPLDIEAISKKRIDDPENKEMGAGWITPKDQAEKFYYFSWLTKSSNNSSSTSGGGRYDNKGGSVGASEDAISAGWIDNLASHALRIQGKVGVSPREMRSAILEMMGTTTDLNEGRGVKKDVKALIWFEDKAKGEWYVRITKSFMNNQKDDVVVEKIKDVTRSYGLKQITYVLGVQDKAVHYVWQVFNVLPSDKRHALQLTNPHYESKTARDISEYLLPSVGGADKFAFTDIRTFMASQMRKLPTLSFTKKEDSLMAFVMIFNLYRIGVEPGTPFTSYHGHSLMYHVGDPENWEKDLVGVEKPKGYHESLYGPGHVSLYDNTENEEDSAKATSLLTMNAWSLWNKKATGVLIDMTNQKIINPLHVTARLSSHEEEESKYDDVDEEQDEFIPPPRADGDDSKECKDAPVAHDYSFSKERSLEVAHVHGDHIVHSKKRQTIGHHEPRSVRHKQQVPPSGGDEDTYDGDDIPSVTG